VKGSYLDFTARWYCVANGPYQTFAERQVLRHSILISDIRIG